MFGLVPVKERTVGFPTPRIFDDFKALQDRLFNAWPMMFEPVSERELFWNLEMKETDKEAIVRAEIPGFELADLEVELRSNQLLVKADKKQENTNKEKGYEF